MVTVQRQRGHGFRCVKVVRLEDACKGADTVDGPWHVCCIKRPIKRKVRRGGADR